MSRSEALKKTQAKHRETLRRVDLSFTAADAELFAKLEARAQETGQSLNAVIKEALRGLL
jgi:predicted HicB family RNase H-like nuclease